VIVVSTLFPVEFRPVTGAPVDLERFLAFGAAAGALSLGYPRYRVLVILLLMALGGILELLQHIVPSRHGHFHDVLAKALGALIGAGAGAITGELPKAVAALRRRS
jgi:hypothetical protein